MPESTTDGFSAWVSIDGVRLPQYGVKTSAIDGVKTVTSWIASEAGKAFEVGWSVPAYPERLLGDVSVDGIYVGGYVHDVGEADSATRSWKRVSDTVARPLIFSRTEFTDEDAYMHVNPDDLGEITVEIWVVKGPQSDTVCARDYSPSEEQPTKIHERTKKAIAHRVTFGKEITTAPPVEVLDCIDERCVMVFVFKYRPRDYLQAEGIIPANPKSAARPHKRIADSEILELSSSEDEEDTEEVRLLRQEELRLKRESLEVQRRETQIRKEELRVQAEELKIQLGTVKVKAKTQRKKAKLEPREPNLQVKSEIIDLT